MSLLHQWQRHSRTEVVTLNMSPCSLLDYVLYSRLCQLEKILGVDLCQLLFPEDKAHKGPSNDSDINNQPGFNKYPTNHYTAPLSPEYYIYHQSRRSSDFARGTESTSYLAHHHGALRPKTFKSVQQKNSEKIKTKYYKINKNSQDESTIKNSSIYSGFSQNQNIILNKKNNRLKQNNKWSAAIAASKEGVKTAREQDKTKFAFFNPRANNQEMCMSSLFSHLSTDYERSSRVETCLKTRKQLKLGKLQLKTPQPWESKMESLVEVANTSEFKEVAKKANILPKKEVKSCNTTLPKLDFNRSTGTRSAPLPHRITQGRLSGSQSAPLPSIANEDEALAKSRSTVFSLPPIVNRRLKLIKKTVTNSNMFGINKVGDSNKPLVTFQSKKKIAHSVDTDTISEHGDEINAQTFFCKPKTRRIRRRFANAKRSSRRNNTPEDSTQLAKYESDGFLVKTNLRSGVPKSISLTQVQVSKSNIATTGITTSDLNEKFVGATNQISAGSNSGDVTVPKTWFHSASCDTSSSSYRILRTGSDLSLSTFGERSKITNCANTYHSSQQSLRTILDRILTQNNVCENVEKTLPIINSLENRSFDAIGDVNGLPFAVEPYVDTDNSVELDMKGSKPNARLSQSRLQQNSGIIVDRDRFSKTSLATGQSKGTDSSTTVLKSYNGNSTHAGPNKKGGLLGQAPFVGNSSFVEEDVPSTTLQKGLNANDLEHCRGCGLGLWKIQPPMSPRFFNLSLVLLTFAESNKNHPSTVTKVVESSRTIYSLIELIKHEQDLASNTIEIYRDKGRWDQLGLPIESTLEDCGFVGSYNWYEPLELTLYYDYDSEYYDCPILMSDYYFVNRKKLQTNKIR